jgi:hypothetical protein
MRQGKNTFKAPDAELKNFKKELTRSNLFISDEYP